MSPLRGQNNVQGAGDAGCVPDALPGYQRYVPEVLQRFESVWGASLPSEEGLRATDMVESILSGAPDERVRCMYIVGENPLLTEPNLAHAREAFERLDFLVVQDIFMHETAELADVVLPAASFAEKEGTFTNSERRVQRVRQVIEPVGQARPDWEIVQDLALRVASRLGLSVAGFDHPTASSVFDEMASLTPMLGGLSHARLDAEGGIQWPCPDATASGHAAPLRRGFPARQGQVHPRSPDGAERGGARRPLPVRAQHRAGALPLARRHDDAPGRGAGGLLAGAAGRDSPAGRGANRDRVGRGGAGRIAARTAGGRRIRNGRCGGRLDLRPVRTSPGERRQTG